MRYTCCGDAKGLIFYFDVMVSTGFICSVQAFYTNALLFMSMTLYLHEQSAYGTYECDYSVFV